tara:strand:+ start:449 stop:1732 length:1284 start_codon:yes stop_codon:yes gene_type:complete
MNINNQLLNNILERENEVETIKSFLNNFYDNKNKVLINRGIYVYGNPGCGKSLFVINLLKDLDYDVIKYDSGDNNKSLVEALSKYNISDTNVSSYFSNKRKKVVIVIDDIDTLSGNDKGGINLLIKLIRNKKTQKQKLEGNSQLPIICIGNNDIDKKNKELMKVCVLCLINIPTRIQIKNLLEIILKKENIKEEILNKLLDFIRSDMRKLNTILNVIIKDNCNVDNCILDNLLNISCNNTNVKNLTYKLFTGDYIIEDHLKIINDTDRTTVGLLWHENVIDILTKVKNAESIKVYHNILENICYGDYIDRVTFQKQIWQFNEISSLIKTFYSNYIIRNYSRNYDISNMDIRFTKVLTKYSTEYNNSIFVNNLCQELNLDNKDMLGYFCYLKNNEDLMKIENLIECCEISTLDINRIFRYIDNCLTVV